MRKLAFAATLGLCLTLSGAALAQLEGPAAGLETEMMDGIDRSLADGGPAGGKGGPSGAIAFEAPMPPPGGMPPPPSGCEFGGPDVLMMAHGGGGRGGFAGLPGGLPDDATLTDEQLEKIYKAKETFQEKAGPKMLDLVNQGRALRDAMMEPELDKAKMQGIQNRMNGLIGEIGSLKLDQQVAILSTFTPEQRKEMRHNFLKRSMGAGGGAGQCGRMMRCRKELMEKRDK